MATVKHKRIGFIYKRRRGTWTYYTRIKAKCLYDFGYDRFFWEYGCGFYSSLYLNDNHWSNWIYTDCHCSFQPDKNVWTHYNDPRKCK